MATAVAQPMAQAVAQPVAYAAQPQMVQGYATAAVPMGQAVG